MNFTIQNFSDKDLDRGLITSDMRAAHSAIVKFDNGDWMGVSRYADEDYWVVDCAFRANGFPLWSNGTGSRVTAGRGIGDETLIAALDSAVMCNAEFGPHEGHDDCERIIDQMSGQSDYDDGLADAYNREAEENMLGRPLFPNEY